MKRFTLIVIVVVVAVAVMWFFAGYSYHRETHTCTIVPPDSQAAYDSLAHRATIRDLARIESGLSTGYLRYDIVEFSRFVGHMHGDDVFGRVGAGITTGGERCIAVYLRNDGRVERLYYFTDITDKLDWIGCVYDRRDGTVQQYGFDLEWW